ncbi:MAG: extracellular solute-binding protein [Acidobacteriota bacterium]
MSSNLFHRFVLAVGCAGALGCSDGRTPVVVYSPHGRDLLAALEHAYEAENPTIDIRWLDMGSQEVYDRVRSERANAQADVWFGGPEAIFGRGDREGLLDVFTPSWAADVPPESRGASGTYYGCYRTLPVLVYNSAAVVEAEAPADWDDLLAARWKGKVIVRDPLASGTMRSMFAMVLARSVAETGDTARGFAWLKRLDGQTKEYASNPALLFQKIVRREGLVTVWELSDILLQQQKGIRVGFKLATSGTPVINDAIGLVKGAPHAEAARAYINWVGGREAQELAARQAFKLPARTDLPAAALPEWAQHVLAALKPAALDWSLIERQQSAWMAEWDREVRGKGGS